jgi:hypothetical protein
MLNEFTDTKNPLAEYGQRPTPPPGSRMGKIFIKNEDHTGYFDRIKERYVWMPMHDLDFIGKMTMQPMCVDYIERGRIAWIQSVAYKALDNSPEAMDQTGDQELPLRTFIMTPFGQCTYLHLNYAEKGIRVFEHLKSEPPELVALIEEILLPEVPADLLSLGKYLTENGEKNIRASELSSDHKKLAYQTLASMLEGTQQAVKYCRELIASTENEILTRRNKGVGKAGLDDKDRFAYTLLRKIIPAETTLDSSPEHKTNVLLEKLVALIDSRNGVTPVATSETESDKAEATIAGLRQELDEMKALFKTAMAQFQTQGTGAPAVEETAEDLTPEKADTEAEALRDRLAQSGKNKLRK